jgi:hypothetical protein
MTVGREMRRRDFEMMQRRSRIPAALLLEYAGEGALTFSDTFIEDRRI